MLKAFELYATGDLSIDLLQMTMTDLGLTTRPSGRWPQEKPVSTSKLHAMLSDPYYAGWVTVDGQLVHGRHTPIISQELFDRVQQVLEARSKLGKRDRVLQHYLKGQLFCQRCDSAGRTSRLIYTEARGRNGEYYGYFLCRSRQDGLCDLPHLPADQVEAAVCRHYVGLKVAEDFASAVRSEIEQGIADSERLTRELDSRLRSQLAKLDAREERLIDLAADGVLSRSKIQERSNSIRVERTRIQAALADTSAELTLGAERLNECLDLVADPAQLYENAPDSVRRQLNQALFEKFLIDDGGNFVAVIEDVLRAPFEEIRTAERVYHLANRSASVTPISKNQKAAPADGSGESVAVLADIYPVGVSSKRVMVELRGFEPLTPSLRTRCATNCATAPDREQPSLAEIRAEAQR